MRIPARVSRERLALAVLFVGLLAVAAGLRFYDLPGNALWYDEAVAANNSRGSLSEIVPNTRYGNSSPIMYPLALWAVQKVESTPFSVLIIPAAASVLTVAVMLFLLPRLGVARQAAFLAALLATLSVAAIYHAQDAREYSVDALLAVLMIAGLLWYLRDGRKGLLCVSLFLAPLLQYGLVLFGGAVIGAAVLLTPPTLEAPERNLYLSRIRNWLKSCIALVWPAACFLAGCAISFAVTLRYQWEEGGFGSDRYLAAYYYQGQLDALSIFEFSVGGIWDLLTYHLPVVVAIAALATFAIILVAVFLRKFQGELQDRAIAVLFSLVIAVSVGAAVLGIYPLGDIRQVIYLGPVVFLAVGVAFHWTAGWLVSLTGRAWLAPALAVTVVGAIVFAGVGDMRQDSPYITPENIKPVLAVLKERTREGDLVYVVGRAGPVIQFYQEKEEGAANYYYGSYRCEDSGELCLREMADLLLSLPDVPNRIFVAHHRRATWPTVSGWAGTTTSGEARLVGDITLRAYLANDKAHRADDNPVQPWLWQRADARPGDVKRPDDATWTDIEGASSFYYTLTDEDVGKFLRAYVSYEKNGRTHRVQTEAVGPTALGFLELLGERVSVKAVFADGVFNVYLITYDKESFGLEARSAYELLVSGEPVIRSGFDVYLSENRLAYVREPCVRADTEGRFFLHLYPVDVNDLPGHRQQYGFDNLDFDFGGRGVVFDGRCVAAVTLPEYDIARISTGQYVRVGGWILRLWEGEFLFDGAE